jgi:hypothetical protein
LDSRKDWRLEQENRPPNRGWHELRDDRALPVWDYLEEAAPADEAFDLALDHHFDLNRVRQLHDAYRDEVQALMGSLAEGINLAQHTFHSSSENGPVDGYRAGVWHAVPWFSPSGRFVDLRGYGAQYIVGIISPALRRMNARRDQMIDDLAREYPLYFKEMIDLVYTVLRENRSIFASTPQELSSLFGPDPIPFVTVNAGVLGMIKGASDYFASLPDPYAFIEDSVNLFNAKYRPDFTISSVDNPIALMAVTLMRIRGATPTERNGAALIVLRFITSRTAKTHRRESEDQTRWATILETILADVFDPRGFRTPTTENALHKFVRRRAKYPEGTRPWANLIPLSEELGARLAVVDGPSVPGSDEHLDMLVQSCLSAVPGSDEHIRLLDEAEAPNSAFDLETPFQERLAEDDTPAARIPHSQVRRSRFADHLHKVYDLVAFAQTRGCQVTGDTVRKMAEKGTITAVERPIRVTESGGVIKRTQGKYSFDTSALDQLAAWISEKRRREDRACLVDLVQLLNNSTERRSAERWVERRERRGLDLQSIVHELRTKLVPKWQVRMQLQRMSLVQLQSVVQRQLHALQESNRKKRRERR